MDLRCPFLRGSSDRRLRRHVATSPIQRSCMEIFTNLIWTVEVSGIISMQHAKLFHILIAKYRQNLSERTFESFYNNLPQQQNSSNLALSKNHQQYEQNVDQNLTKDCNYGIYVRSQLSKTSSKLPTSYFSNFLIFFFNLKSAQRMIKSSIFTL